MWTPFQFFLSLFCPGFDLIFVPTGQSSEGQSKDAGAPEEQEEREAQDGSLWWHGMFVKAGRMGNMASDVKAGSKPEVCAFFLVFYTSPVSGL